MIDSSAVLTVCATRMCGKCMTVKPLNADNFYVMRPNAGHPNGGWQAHCKSCWREVNRANKERRARMYAR